MLFIEYDVTTDGVVEPVAVIEATESNGDDPNGEAWYQWRRSMEDSGVGCAPLTAEVMAELEGTSDPDRLRAVVERVILADRRSKEEPG